MDYGHVPLLVYLLERAHSRVKAQFVVQPENVVLGNLQRRASVVVVVGIGVRDHRVEIVIASSQLEHDHNRWGFY